ncbi:MAG TPA: ABC transporter permease [Bacteroidetes bacterium]|nr:ABC transporter permease [Bacteroidota bacterium]
MRTILIIIQKEFLQIFRNRMILPMIFIVPLVQMLILVYAATMEVKHIDLLVVDRDNSQYSRGLISKLSGMKIYRVAVIPTAGKEAETCLLDNSADAVLEIPPDCERLLMQRQNSSVQLRMDAVDGMAAGIINQYTSLTINNYHKKWLASLMPGNAGNDLSQIRVIPRYWYNPGLNYKHYMLPGILVILVTIMGMFLSAINLVREKELGTIEQINVTPIRRIHFIPGKLIPFWIIALVELSFGLTIGWLLFRVPVRGSLLLLFGFTSVYLLAVMGIGLFLAALSRTQQQLMFVYFFVMLTFLLMSGLFTPVESMPQWAQTVNHINPFAYFMRVIRMILLKGSGFRDILPEFISMSIYAVAALILAVWRYRKTI